MAFHGEGRAVLCFPRDGDWFQGYVFVQDPEADVQLGILAEELPIDDWYDTKVRWVQTDGECVDGRR